MVSQNKASRGATGDAQHEVVRHLLVGIDVAGAAATRGRDVVDDVPRDHRASSGGRRPDVPARPRRPRAEEEQIRLVKKPIYASKLTPNVLLGKTFPRAACSPRRHGRGVPSDGRRLRPRRAVGRGAPAQGPRCRASRSEKGIRRRPHFHSRGRVLARGDGERGQPKGRAPERAGHHERRTGGRVLLALRPAER